MVAVSVPVLPQHTTMVHDGINVDPGNIRPGVPAVKIFNLPVGREGSRTHVLESTAHCNSVYGVVAALQEGENFT
jgi:hypothetical protein